MHVRTVSLPALMGAAMGLALCLAVVTPAQAEVPLTFTLGGTSNFFDNDREVDDEVTPFAAAEYRFTERWATEIWFADGETDGDNGFDADITRWHLDALYYLTPRGKLHPYLAGGVGQLDREWDVPNGNLDEVDEELNFGGGAHFFLTDNLSLRGDARYLYGMDDNTSDFTLSLALSYRFGGKTERKAAAEPVAAAAVAATSVAAPVDTDGDGVMDKDDACPNSPAGAKVDERGCKMRFVQGESAALDVRFAFDSAVVDDSYLDDIKEFADFLKRHPDATATIEAHTDSMGPEDYNLSLSQRRAESVIDILEDRFDVPAGQLTAKGFGESEPLADNATPLGRAKNRRVMANLEVEDEMVVDE